MSETKLKAQGIELDKCAAYSAANPGQSLDTATWTAINLDSAEYYDSTGDMHDLTTNNSRIYVSKTGLYLVVANMCFVANASGVRHIYIRVNGSGNEYGWDSRTNNGGSQGCALSTSAIIELNAGDYVEMMGYQNSGGALALTIQTRNTLSVQQLA